MEDETREFLVLIMNTISWVLLWMMLNVLIGIYFGLGFFETVPTWKNILYYSFLLLSAIFLIRYLNSLTIGSSISVQEIESQAKYASDFIMGVTVNNLSVDKKNIPNVNYRLSDDKSYMGAGAVGVYSVIIGSSGY